MIAFMEWAEFFIFGWTSSLTYYILSMYTELEVHITVKKLYTFIGHTLFYGPILAINKPLNMTFASRNS